MPESEMRVVTPNVFMLGIVSFSYIASASFLSLPEHAGNKTNITAARNAAVMFSDFKYVLFLFKDMSYLIVVVSPIHPPIVTAEPFFKPMKNKSSSFGV